MKLDASSADMQPKRHGTIATRLGPPRAASPTRAALPQGMGDRPVIRLAASPDGRAEGETRIPGGYRRASRGVFPAPPFSTE